MIQFTRHVKAAFNIGIFETVQEALLTIPSAVYRDLAVEILKMSQQKTKSSAIFSMLARFLDSKSSDLALSKITDPLDFSAKPLSTLATLLVIMSAKLLLQIRSHQQDNNKLNFQLNFVYIGPILLQLVCLWYDSTPDHPYHNAAGAAAKFNDRFILEAERLKLLVTLVEHEHLVTGEPTPQILERLADNMAKLPAVFGFKKEPQFKDSAVKLLFAHKQQAVSPNSPKELWEHLLLVLKLGIGTGQSSDEFPERILALEARLQQLLYRPGVLNLTEQLVSPNLPQKLDQHLQSFVSIIETAESQLKRSTQPDQIGYLIRYLIQILKCVVWLTGQAVKVGSATMGGVGFTPGFVFRRVLGVLLHEGGLLFHFPESTPNNHRRLNEQTQASLTHQLAQALVYPLPLETLTANQLESEHSGVQELFSSACCDGLLLLLHGRLLAQVHPQTPTVPRSKVVFPDIEDWSPRLPASPEQQDSQSRTTERGLLELCCWWLADPEQYQNKVYRFLELQLLHQHKKGTKLTKSLGHNLTPDNLESKLEMAIRLLKPNSVSSSIEILYSVSLEILLLLRDFTPQFIWSKHEFSSTSLIQKIDDPILFGSLTQLDTILKQVRFRLDLEHVQSGWLTRKCQMLLTELQAVIYELIPPGYICSQSRYSIWNDHFKADQGDSKPFEDQFKLIADTFSMSVADTLAPTDFDRTIAVLSNLGLAPEARRNNVPYDPKLESLAQFKALFTHSLAVQLNMETGSRSDLTILMVKPVYKEVYVPGLKSLEVASITDLVEMLFVDIRVYSLLAPHLYKIPIKQFLDGHLLFTTSQGQQGSQQASINQFGQPLMYHGIMESTNPNALKFITWFDQQFGKVSKHFGLLDEPIFLDHDQQQVRKLKHKDPEDREYCQRIGSASIQIMHAQLAIQIFVNINNLEITLRQGKEDKSSKCFDYEIWGQPYFLTILSLPSPGRDFCFRNFFVNFLKIVVEGGDSHDKFHRDYPELVSVVLPELDIPWTQPFVLREYSHTIQGAQFMPPTAGQLLKHQAPQFSRYEWMNLILKPSQIIDALLSRVLCQEEFAPLICELQSFIGEFSAPNAFEISHGYHFGTRLPLCIYLDTCFMRILHIFLQSVQLLNNTNSVTLGGLQKITTLQQILNLKQSNTAEARVATDLLVNVIQIQRLAHKLIALDSQLDSAVLMVVIRLLETLSDSLPALEYLELEMHVELFKFYCRKHEDVEEEQRRALKYLKDIRFGIVSSLSGQTNKTSDPRLRLVDRYLIEAQLAHGEMFAMETVYEHLRWWSYSRTGELHVPNEHYLVQMLSILKSEVTTVDKRREYMVPTRLLFSTHSFSQDVQEEAKKMTQLIERDKFYEFEIARLLSYRLIHHYGPLSSAQWFVRIACEKDIKLNYEGGYRMVKNLNLQFRKDISSGLLNGAFECFFICVVTKLLTMGTKHTV